MEKVNIIRHFTISLDLTDFDSPSSSYLEFVNSPIYYQTLEFENLIAAVRVVRVLVLVGGLLGGMPVVVYQSTISPFLRSSATMKKIFSEK